MDLVNIKGAKWREIFDINLCQLTVRNGITRTFQKTFKSEYLNALRVPIVYDEILGIIWVRDSYVVNFATKLELSCDADFILKHLADVVYVQFSLLIDSHYEIFRDGCMD